MTRRRSDGHRFVRWLWTSRRFDARAARALLVPASGLYGAVMRLRARAYRRGWLASHDLPRPTIAVGNLTVGGSGKTPIAGWVAAWRVDSLTTLARWLTMPGVVLALFGGAALREALRASRLDLAHNQALLDHHQSAVAIGGFWLFAVFLVLNAAIIAGCVALVVRSLKSQ